MNKQTKKKKMRDRRRHGSTALTLESQEMTHSSYSLFSLLGHWVSLEFD